MNISKEGIALIKKFEGCELTAYQDAVDVWTIGYGHTKGVKKGDSITKEEADSMLMHELLEYCSHVENAVEVPLKQCMYDALVSWTYNLGPTNLNHRDLALNTDSNFPSTNSMSGSTILFRGRR